MALLNSNWVPNSRCLYDSKLYLQSVILKSLSNHLFILFVHVTVLLHCFDGLILAFIHSHLTPCGIRHCKALNPNKIQSLINRVAGFFSSCSYCRFQHVSHYTKYKAFLPTSCRSIRVSKPRDKQPILNHLF